MCLGYMCQRRVLVLGGMDRVVSKFRRKGNRELGNGVPFMLMLSPRLASVRISAQSEMVREVPPPPAAVSSCFSSRVTAGCVSLAEKIAGLK